MEYRRMGRSGLKVSSFCLGTMTFGHGTEEEEAIRMVDLATDAGVNFFDTANVYAYGASEEILGRAINDFANRDEVVIATKVFVPMRKGPNGGGLSRKHIMSQIDQSLTRLNMDYVDL